MDKLAVVTGGHRGIGKAISETLLNAGCRVVIGARNVHDHRLPGLSELARNERLTAWPLDVRSSASVADFTHHVTDTMGHPDVLVNSAGVSLHQLVSEHTDAQWNDVIDTNLSGPFRMIRAVLPAMKQQRWGRIINIASTAAHTAVADHAAYCASKSGLLGLSRAVALEGAAFGVTSVTVSPTWVETDMLHDSASVIAEQRQRPLADIHRELELSNPQQRLVQPSEIAALVLFLCSDAAAGLTMEDIQINAGTHW